MRLRKEHHAILRAAVDAGGSYSISGLELRDMVVAADLVLDMQRVRLIKTKIVFVAKQPAIIPVEITAEGRRALAAG